MNPERDNYQALLESLADGVEVDWAALDAAATTDAERGRNRNLRLVARVAELHRTLVLDDEDVAASANLTDSADDPTTWGHLSVRARLAAGAFGRIYRAHDPQLNREVALKLLRGDISTARPIEPLLAEARTLARVHHPNVVTVYGADVRDGRAGLWMELVDGQTLEAWLRTNGPMGSGEATAVSIDLCRALAAVHGAGLVHGDVKAQNVMREQGGRIVLMDFGAGRAQGADATGVAGTPMYLAPEVLAGEPPTPRSDLYSLGVLLFHLLTASYPYTGADLDGLRAAHADGTRTWLRDPRPDLPDRLVQSIERALDADPARRFATAGEMERALREALDAPGRAAEAFSIPAAVVETSDAPASWSRFGFAIGALALLCVVAGLIVASSGRGSAPATPGVKSIAVLPMTDLSGSQQAPYLADGLHDQLITTLGQIQSLRVMSRTSVMQFKGSHASAGEIAKKLGVDAVLESTMLSTGGGSAGSPGRVRVNASLVTAGARTPLWSKTFERPLGDLLSLEAEVARAIAASVRAAITAGESARLSHAQQTSAAAEEAYFQGRRHLEQYGSDRARRAQEAFNRAIQLDPQHAAAHAGAARAYLSLGFNGDISQPEARASAFSELQKAVALDENLPEGRAALADIKFYYDWDWIGAEAEYRRAMALNPSFTFAQRRFASYLAAARRLDEAVQQASEAEVLDPLSAEAATTHGMTLYYYRNYQAARSTLSRALQLEPESAAALILLGRIEEAEGQFEEALQKTRQALKLVGGGSIPLRVQIVCLEALAGHKEDARRNLQELQRTAAAGKLRISAEYLAYAHIALGDHATALDLLERAVEERDPGVLWLAVDPRVDGVRSEPRFAAILNRLGLPEKHTRQP
jgi:eukaryotic-like serine/threonine-protein kinase